MPRTGSGSTYDDTASGSSTPVGRVLSAQNPAPELALYDAAGVARAPFGWSDERLAALVSAYRRRGEQWTDRAEARSAAREALADYLERTVQPAAGSPEMEHRISTIVERLRTARRWAELQYNPADARWLCLWEHKADLPLLCPDDANDEFQRLKDRYLPKLIEWSEGGGRVYSMVFTRRLAAPGTLHVAMRSMWKDVRKCLDKFDEVHGVLATMEAPLSVHRGWHVHLNVLVLADAHIAYKLMRERWGGLNVEQQLLGHEPGQPFRPLFGDEAREVIGNACRELVKYAARTVADKSSDHGKRAKAKAEDREPAPAMVEWTAAEWLEWWAAHRGFRRTRSWGLLFGKKVPKPKRHDSSGFIAVGHVERIDGRYVVRSPLLDSIQGHKSVSTASAFPPLDRWEFSKRARGPPD